jgi:hypothetical protein
VKTLNLLIKLEKRKVEQILLEKKSVAQEIALHEIEVEKLEDRIINETQKYTGTEFAIYLEKFIESTKLNINNINQKIYSYQNILQKLEEELILAFSEQKRYEIILAAKIKEKEKKSLAKQLKEIDEMNILKAGSLNADN